MTAPVTPADAAAGAAALIAANQGTDLVATTVAGVSLATAATISSITARTKAALQAMWLPVDPYKDAQVAAFVKRANPILIAAQKATAQTAAAAQTTMLASMGVNSRVVPKLPDDIRVPHAQATTITYDNGDKPATQVSVTPKDSTNEALLERPAKALRWRESVGDSRQDAQSLSITRLDDVIDGNLVIAQRDAEHQALNATILDYQGHATTRSQTRTRTGVRIIGFRRIIHPEFSTGGVCGLCVAASDRVYHRETLRPIHLRCKCTSAPVTATYDPGLDLNDADIKRLKTEAGSNSAADLKRTRYTVTHTELGPVLAPAEGETVPYFRPQAPVSLDDSPSRKKPGPVNQADIPHNRDPEKGRTVPTFVGGDSPRTPAQKAAANKVLADLLANIKDQ